MRCFSRAKIFFSCLLFCLLFTIFLAIECYGEPKGAKAIFESGEGPSTVTAINKKQGVSSTQIPATKEKYIGISYQILLMKPNGSFTPVSKYRIFRSGERIKLLVRTNRSGYLTIVNIGPTGNTNIIHNDYVEAHNFVEIPKNANLVFSGPSGTEKLLIMLSATPNPLFNGGMTTVHSPTQSHTTPSVPSQTHTERQPGSSSPNLLPTDLIASLESAKSLRGAKDLMVEDNMKSTFTVISPQNQFQPSGGKDILVESYRGVNYGVIPASAINNGGILTLQINLTHKE